MIRVSGHLVELALASGPALKIAIAPAFGLVPRLKELPVVYRHSEHPRTRTVSEFFPATPLLALEMRS